MDPNDLMPQSVGRSQGNAKSRPVSRWQAFLAERLSPLMLMMPDAGLIPGLVAPQVVRRPIASNWMPLGPSVVRRGEALLAGAMSGRKALSVLR
jgi:hypothetical protein